LKMITDQGKVSAEVHWIHLVFSLRSSLERVVTPIALHACQPGRCSDSMCVIDRAQHGFSANEWEESCVGNRSGNNVLSLLRWKTGLGEGKNRCCAQLKIRWSR
jgi:hypothetical protein